MKTSVVLFVGFLLFGCAGAKPQNSLNNVEKHISGIRRDIIKFNGEIFKTLRDDVLAILPIDEAKEYYQQLQNSPEWMALTDLINGTELQEILDRIRESRAYKSLVKCYGEILESFEKTLNTIISQATKFSPLSN